MKALIVTFVAGASTFNVACADDTHVPDAGCVNCCNCQCTDNTLSIDATDRCLDCATECLDICERYGGGGGEGSEPCDAP